MTTKLFYILLALILTLGIGLRFAWLGQVPTGLYVDEAAMLLDAKTVSQSGLDMHSRPWYQIIYPSYGDYKLPVYIWLATLSVKVLGVSELALRLPSALAGVGTIVVAGLIARELALIYQRPKSGRILQLATMLVVTVSPWSILFSRTAFEGHLAQFLLALSVLMAFNARKNAHWLLGSAVLGGLATYTYFSVRFVWPVILVAVSGLFLINWPKLVPQPGKLLLELIKNMVLPLVIFGLLLVPMFQSPLYGDSNRYRLGTDSVLSGEWAIQSNIYRELAGNTPVDRLLFHRSWLQARELIRNYTDHLSLNYLYLEGDSNLRHGTQFHGVFLLPFLPFLLIGLYDLFNRYRRLFFLLIIWWLVALLPASVPETTPHALRSLNALVPLSLIHGFGIAWAVEQAWQRRVQWWVKIMAEGVYLVIAASIISFTWFYFKLYPAWSAESWQSGYRELVQATMAMEPTESVYVISFNDRFYLWYLVYANYTAAEIQSSAEAGYIFTDIKRLVLTDRDWSQLPTEKSIVVAGLLEDIERLERESQGLVEASHTVYNAAGEVKYKVIKIDL